MTRRLAPAVGAESMPETLLGEPMAVDPDWLLAGQADRQRRNGPMVAAKAAGSCTQGKWPAPGWTITVASGNSGAARAARPGVTSGSNSPAYSSTGAVSFARAARMAGTSKDTPAK